MKTLKTSLIVAFGLTAAVAAQAATELVIATVNNGHMIEMQKLTPHFEKANPDIKLKWVTLEEGTLRQRVTTDIATKGGQFDVMTIGMYETPIWAKKGWLKEIKPDAAYDVDDLLPAIRNGLSVDGKLYAAPFYGESSMLMYRKDLADKAGIKIARAPDLGRRCSDARRQDPRPGRRRLRHLPARQAGLGRQHGLPDDDGQHLRRPVVRHELEAADRHQAVEGRGHVLRRPAEQVRPARLRRPTASTRSWRCSTKASAACGSTRPSPPRSSATRSRARWPTRWPSRRARTAVTPKGANWLWAWALAIPAGHQERRRGAEVRQLGDLEGLHQPGGQGKGLGRRADRHAQVDLRQPRVPEGRRFRRSREEGASTAPTRTTARCPSSPYVGVQYAAIPEFQAIGIAVGQQMSAALAGKMTVDAGAEDLADRGRARDAQGRLLQVSSADDGGAAVVRAAGRDTEPPSPRPALRQVNARAGAAVSFRFAKASHEPIPAPRADGAGRGHAVPLDDRAAGDDDLFLVRPLQPDAARRDDLRRPGELPVLRHRPRLLAGGVEHAAADRQRDRHHRGARHRCWRCWSTSRSRAAASCACC